MARTNSVKTELEPSGLFASAIDRAVLGEGGIGPEPDLLYEIRQKDKIMDLKTCASNGTYLTKSTEGAAATKYEEGSRKTLMREVRQWDEKMKLAEGEGPIKGRLNHYGGMTYCAVGKYGEAGKGTEHEQWMEWGARGGDDYEGKGIWGIRPDARWESNKGY